MTDLIPFLKKSSLFDGVTDSELDKLAQLCSTVTYKKGKRIMSTNDTLEYIYIIKSGKLAIFIEGHDHKKEYLPEITKGDILGEMEIFDQKQIIACAEVKTKQATLLKVEKSDFKKFLTQTPIVLDRVFTNTVKKWRNIEHQFNQNITHLNEAIEKIKLDEELLYKQQKQIEEESHLKEIFIENISHELRTPLTIIQGVIEAIQIEDGKKISFDKDLFKKLQNSSSYLLDLINELLDFSQLSKGITNLNYNWYNITKELSSIMDNLIFSTLKPGKDIQITYDLPEPIYLFIDIKRIRQILFHLISNAVKFTERGSIVISISCTNFINESCMLIINVKDTGIGISEEDQKIIFNKFVRIKNKYYTLRGTGLGLSLVKTLIDLMHGTIEIESHIDVGTEFKLKIPFSYKEISENPIISTLESTNKTKRTNPIKVLLIDDYEDTHVIVRALLNKYNIKIDSLFDSKKVLETVSNNQYEIILLDIMLPEVDGYEILESLKAHYKKGSNIKNIPKIIAFTALRSEIELEKINKAGFNGLLLKPFTKDDLINTILPIVQ